MPTKEGANKSVVANKSEKKLKEEGRGIVGAGMDEAKVFSAALSYEGFRLILVLLAFTAVVFTVSPPSCDMNVSLEVAGKRIIHIDGKIVRGGAGATDGEGGIGSGPGGGGFGDLEDAREAEWLCRSAAGNVIDDGDGEIVGAVEREAYWGCVQKRIFAVDRLMQAHNCLKKWRRKSSSAAAMLGSRPKCLDE